MRVSLVGAATVALCVGVLAASTLLAQRPAAVTARRSSVALVDAAGTATKSVRLKQALEALKREHEASAEGFKKESERGNQLGEQLRKSPPNSPEFKKLEGEITKMRADFELRGKIVTKEVSEREAKLYHAFSRELREEVARFAQATGTPLVLRFEPTPPELTDPRVILHEVQRLIVYQRDLEATPTVLEAMNRRAGAATAANRPAGQPAQSRPVQR